MRPVQFECTAVIPCTASVIAANIADVTRWREFQGYGFLPGIAQAEYEQRSATMVGSCVRVRNTDGSQHREEFLEWNPEQKIVIKLYDFSPPVSSLATHFIEAWDFEARGSVTFARRSFQLFPKRTMTRPLLWLISLIFKPAIVRHLAEMAAEAKRVGGSTLPYGVNR